MDDLRIDGHKLDLHPRRVADWLASGDDWGKAKKVYPIYWEITTAAACNHRCSFCSVDAIGYPNIMIDRAVLRERLLEAGVPGLKSVMFAGTGEPLLHKQIDDIVCDAREAGLDVSFTTNGVLLHKLETLDKCSWVKISLNAGTRENYAAIHRTNPKDWDSIWSHLPGVITRKGACKVGIQAVVLPENVDEMKLLASRARDAGADYLVLKPYSQATFSIVHRDDIHYGSMQRDLAELPEQFDTDTFKVIYRANAIRQEDESHQYPRCNATPFFWCYSMANGDVFTCSAHLLDARFKIGNLTRQTFRKIWEGDKRRENWRLMRDEFDIKNCRKNCRMNGSNIYLHRISTAEHRNFI